MTIEQRLDEDTKTAARAKSPELGVLRLLRAALHNEQIARRGEPFGEAEVLLVLRREHKKRVEATQLYEQGGRAELAQAEREEAKVIERYLPASPAVEVIEAKARELAAELKLEGPKGMGQLIKALTAHFAGAVDGASASAAARKALGNA